MITDEYSDNEILDAANIVARCINSGSLHSIDLKTLSREDARSNSLAMLVNIIDGREVLLDINGVSVAIDRGILQSVKHLNSLGLTTLYSCDGHYRQKPYIMVEGIVNFELESLTLEYSVLRNYTVIRGSLGFDDLDSLDKLLEFNYKLLSLDKSSYKLGLCNSFLTVYNKLELDVLSYICGTDILPNCGSYTDRILKSLKSSLDSLESRYPNTTERVKTLLDYLQSDVHEMNIF